MNDLNMLLLCFKEKMADFDIKVQSYMGNDAVILGNVQPRT